MTRLRTYRDGKSTGGPTCHVHAIKLVDRASCHLPGDGTTITLEEWQRQAKAEQEKELVSA